MNPASRLPLRRTCKEACALITARQDRALPVADRIALRLHLLACKACPTFDRQIRLMEEAMGSWRRYAQRED
jgi:Putative zinc-finger